MSHMHVLGRNNNMLRGDACVRSCRTGKSAPAAGIKKPAEGAAGKDHFKKWRERKTEIDYRSPLMRSLGLLQLLTKLGKS